MKATPIAGEYSGIEGTLIGNESLNKREAMRRTSILRVNLVAVLFPNHRSDAGFFIIFRQGGQFVAAHHGECWGRRCHPHYISTPSFNILSSSLRFCIQRRAHNHLLQEGETAGLKSFRISEILL